MGAKMVDFGGWDMPVNYGSQIDEHHQVRNDCGMFDVCHMRVVDAKGDGVRAFLRYLLANNADKLTLPGKALYSAMLRPDGGVIDEDASGPGSAEAVVCDLWTDGAATVKVTAQGYSDTEQDLKAESDDCGLKLTPETITLEQGD